MTETRFRINAKQTAKNEWYFDCTLEMGTDFFTVEDSKDLANSKEQFIGEKLLETINKTMQLFKNDGKKLVGENE